MQRVRYVGIILGVILLLLLAGELPTLPTPPSSNGATSANVDAAGGYRTSIPIEVPPYHGLEPTLSLTYNSNSGDSWLGIGWSLSGLSTIRRASPGKGAPHYDGSDIFLLDGMELIPCTLNMISPSCKYPASSLYQSYATKIESFDRIAFDPNRTAGGTWFLWDKTGTKYTYEARGYRASNKPFAWDVVNVEDTLGNKVTYSRQQSAAVAGIEETYLDAIYYNGTIIKFYYEPRPDVVSYAIGYDLVNVRERLKTIDITVGRVRARTYTLQYTVRTGTGRSFLTEVRQYGRDAQVNQFQHVRGYQLGDVTNAQSIASLKLATLEAQTKTGGVWGDSETSDSSWGAPQDIGPLPPVLNGVAIPFSFQISRDVSIPYPLTTAPLLGDVDGNGQTDWILASNQLGLGSILIMTALAGKSPPITVQTILPYTSSDLIYHKYAADVNGDGRTDLIFISGEIIPGEINTSGEIFIHLNVAFSVGDGHFEWATTNSQSTSWRSHEFTPSVSHCQPGDVNGDRRDDLVCSFIKPDGSHHIGTALSLGDGTFEIFEKPAPFSPEFETIPMSVGDTNADGLDDAMFLDPAPCPPETPGCIMNYDLVTALSLGNGDYQFARTPTNWSVVNSDPSFFAADINGDGKSDYVLLKGPDLSLGETDGAILTARSQPTGNFLFENQPIPMLSTFPEYSYSIGDVNGDGKVDILIMSRQEPHKPGCSSTINYPHVNLHRILSRGDGTFELPPSLEDCQNSRELEIKWENIGPSPVESEAADINGDGAADFLLSVIVGNDDFTTLHEDLSPHPTGDTFNWTPADANGDGKKDWIYIRSTPTGPLISTLLSHNNTYITVSQSPIPGTERFTSLQNWKVMDVDGDGRDDLVNVFYLSKAEGIQVSTWFSNGNGSWRFKSQKVFSGLPETDRNTPSWRPMDINGDGKTDLVYISPKEVTIRVLISIGDGQWRETGLGNWSSQSWVATATDLHNWHSADINGDGKADLVYLQNLNPGVRIHSLLSNGDGTWAGGFSNPDEEWKDPQLGQNLFDTSSWKVMDINGDGMTDLVHLSPSNRTSGQPTTLQIQSLLSNGNGSWTPQDPQVAGTFVGDMLRWQPANVTGDHRGDFVHVYVLPPKAIVTTLSQTGNGAWILRSNPMSTTATNDNYGVFFKVGDVDGNGEDDLTRIDLLASGMRVFSLLSESPNDLLDKLTNTLGGITQIKYKPSSTWAVNDTSPGCYLPVGVVMQSVSTISVTDGRSSIVSPQGYDYSCARWSYKERGFLAWKEIDATSSDSQERPGRVTFSLNQVTDQCLVQPGYTQIHDSTGKVFKKTITAYINPGPAPPYKCLVLYLNQIESNQNTIGQNVYTYYDYDEFGNIKFVYEHGAELDPNDDRTTSIAYNPAVSPYIVSLPMSEQVHAGPDTSGNVMRASIFCYDSDSTLTCLNPPTKGLLSARKDLNKNGLATTNYYYDPFGNLAGVQDANFHGKTIFYDNSYHVYPIAICNALSQCEGQEWDYVIGQTTAIIDINNERTELHYDVLGRLQETDYPNMGILKETYSDWGNPKSQKVRETLNDGTIDGLWTDTYYDGLGRSYRIIQKGDAPSIVFEQDTNYADASQLIYRQSTWYKSGENPVYEKFQYDPVGRLVRQTHPDNTYSQWIYGNNQNQTWIASYDELNHEQVTYSDAYGRISQVHEMNAGQTADTFYTYNSVDELHTITDSQRNVISTLEWDLLGHNTSLTDADRGTSTYTSDMVGNVKTLTDARNLTLTFTYDSLNRLKTKLYPDGRLVQWNYDEPGHGAGKGRLTSITDSAETLCPSNRSEDLTYDVMGQVTLQRQCIEGLTYEMGFGYDPLGRLKTVTYPNNEVVTYGYDTAGRLENMPGYINSLSYDAAGHLTGVEYANQTKTTMNYDPSRQWLKDVTVSNGSNTLYQVGYDEYHANGLVRKTTSTTNHMNLLFTYDDLNRLTNEDGDLQQTFHYDTIGNISYNSEIGTYTYLNSTVGRGCGVVSPSPCPHAVKRTLSPQMHQEFTYDADGNLTFESHDDTSGHKERSIEWNADNQPYLIQDFKGIWTNVRYDASGQRVYRERDGEITQYYGGYMDLSYSASGGALNKTQYYYAGSLLVARKDASGTYWYHQDQLGSIRLMTDQSGTVVARYDYKPFGEIASSSATVPTDIQFTGQRTDTENGLVYMGARYFDPQIGRFISADTLIPDVQNPQALNRYSYVYNNPISYTDPTGHQPEGSNPDPGISWEQTTWDQWASLSADGMVYSSSMPPLLKSEIPTNIGLTNLGGACSICHQPRIGSAPRYDLVNASQNLVTAVEWLATNYPELFPVSESVQITEGDPGSGNFGLTDHWTGNIIIAPNRPVDKTINTLAHELMHSRLTVLERLWQNASFVLQGKGLINNTGEHDFINDIGSAVSNHYSLSQNQQGFDPRNLRETVYGQPIIQGTKATLIYDGINAKSKFGDEATGRVDRNMWWNTIR